MTTDEIRAALICNGTMELAEQSLTLTMPQISHVAKLLATECDAEETAHDNHMRVLSVNYAESNKLGVAGIVLSFTAETPIAMKTIVTVTVDKSKYQFEVININASSAGILISCKETGYYAGKLSNRTGININSLLGAELSIMTDEKEIAQIKKECGYC